MMYMPIGLTYRGLELFTIIAGAIVLWNKNHPTLLMLTIPLLFVLFASHLGKYPFNGRFILFMLPALLILLAQRIGALIEQKNISVRATGIALLVVLYAESFAHGVKYFVQPRLIPDVTPLLKYLQENWEDGSILYCTWYTVEQL